MKDIKANAITGIQNGTLVNIIDNSGGKIARIIAFRNYRGTCRRLQRGGIASFCIVSVIRGTLELRKAKGVQYAIIVRQRGAIHRTNGERVCFEDNAGILTSKEGEPKGTMIRGVVAREAVLRWPTIGNLATKIR